MTPPHAKKIPLKLETHGHVRIDNYYWLREREDPEVIAYLEAENEYTEKIMAHTEAFQESLFEEIKARIKQDDTSVPYKLKDFYYYARFEENKQYPIHCRRRGTLEAPESVMLDLNELAVGHDFYAVSGRAISYNQDILAYAEDTRGRRIYSIRFKDLETGEILDDAISEVTGNMVWANDNKTLFYSKQDLVTLRSHRIYRHTLGTGPESDVLVYEEPDETFTCSVGKTKSRKFIIIGSSQTLSNEYRFLNADEPAGEFKLFAPRVRNHEYDIDHYGDYFYVRSNDQAQNFRLLRTPETGTAQSNWEEVIPHREAVLLRSFELFKDHLVLEERKDGLVRIRIIPWDGSGEHYLEFGEPAYLAYVGLNPEADSRILRYGYTSLTTPNSTYDYDMGTREKVLMKRDEVLGGFDPGDYTTELLHATARDGTRVPISIVYRNDRPKAPSSPLLLYAYGSYGISTNATFSSSRLSLLDRGFAFAIAHVRGGQELGRRWYDEGKLLNKKNTFADFVDCADYLVSRGYTSPEHLFATGGSAGGLLMGAIVNMRPELFCGVVTRVPFVDVVTTMLDDDIPLTTNEYDEWGNPNDKVYYDYILSYSPYDNVASKAYPNLLVTTGLHDSQVQYWEPAKWVAKLRANKTDSNRLLLKTNIEAGHGGASGRYNAYKETALDYAFMLDLAGIKE
ncbi:MAG: S9 family peptidase [Candidatus Hydrogenedentes bacterium]|nr:S9 family peptidase [Candidatus Hydrogenedentota bacterium]